MILSDRDIRAELEHGGLKILPQIESRDLQAASVDVHLGPQLKTRDGRIIAWDDAYLLPPRGFLLGHTIEEVEIPNHLVIQVDGKSTQARLGLSVHQTAGWLDPGFKGQITLELYNCSSAPIALIRGGAIAQLVFMRLSSPALRPYGHPETGNHYQGQLGATPSHYVSDDGR